MVKRQSRSPALRSLVATRKATTACASVSPYADRIERTVSGEQETPTSWETSSMTG